MQLYVSAKQRGSLPGAAIPILPVQQMGSKEQTILQKATHLPGLTRLSAFFFFFFCSFGVLSFVLLTGQTWSLVAPTSNTKGDMSLWFHLVFPYWFPDRAPFSKPPISGKRKRKPVFLGPPVVPFLTPFLVGRVFFLK